MDAAAALTYTIARTKVSADVYGVTAAQLAEAAAAVHALDHAQRNAYATTTVLGTLVGIAGEHQAECERDDCRTCDAVRVGLAGTIAGLRTLLSEMRV